MENKIEETNKINTTEVKETEEEKNDGINFFCVILAMLSFFALLMYVNSNDDNGVSEKDKKYKENFTLIVDDIDIKYNNNEAFYWLKEYYDNDGYYVFLKEKKTNSQRNLFIHNHYFDRSEIQTLSYCKIDFYKKAWYISNEDLKNCRKEDSLKAVLKITRILNEDFDKEQERINSWQK